MLRRRSYAKEYSQGRGFSGICAGCLKCSAASCSIAVDDGGCAGNGYWSAILSQIWSRPHSRSSWSPESRCILSWCIRGLIRCLCCRDQLFWLPRRAGLWLWLLEWLPNRQFCPAFLVSWAGSQGKAPSALQLSLTRKPYKRSQQENARCLDLI